MIKKVARNEMRKKRHYRIRKNVTGTASRPRLNVFRSNTNIYAQVIDDEAGNTIVSFSTLSKEEIHNLLLNVLKDSGYI